jgi:hypothetical protein
VPDACDAQQVGRADVGRQHAFLDQLVRVVAGARQDLFDLADALQTI